jgi:chromosome partitioning protein
MPVISLANPKGGSGKSTSALVLALEFSKVAKAAIIDADPNQIIGKWANKRLKENRPAPITVVSKPSEGEMIRTIADLSESHQFVFVDLEGTASRLMSRALGRSHLVLIPLNPSPIDAELAAQAVQLIFEETEALGRDIPFRLLWSRYPNAVKTRSFKEIEAKIRQADLPVLGTGLVERAAFRDIFARGVTLDEILRDAEAKPASSNSELKNKAADVVRITAALDNAHALASDVVNALKDLKN